MLFFLQKSPHIKAQKHDIVDEYKSTREIDRQVQVCRRNLPHGTSFQHY